MQNGFGRSRRTGDNIGITHRLLRIRNETSAEFIGNGAPDRFIARPQSQLTA
jgi:hypothetical protein